MADSENGKPVDPTPPTDSGEGDITPESEAAAKAEAEAKAKAAAEAKAKAAAAKAAAEAAKEPWERDPVAPQWEETEDNSLVDALREAHGDAILAAHTIAGDLVIEVASESIREVCQSLKEDQGFKQLVDIFGAHLAKREEKPLEVIYIFDNLESNLHVRLRVRFDEEVEIPSVTPVYAGANWSEREAYDMYGIRFTDHPDMTRILMWEGFNGFPLRKEFPVEGIDTGAAIYPEEYTGTSGPIAGTGTGWKPPAPTDEVEAEAEAEGEES